MGTKVVLYKYSKKTALDILYVDLLLTINIIINVTILKILTLIN